MIVLALLAVGITIAVHFSGVKKDILAPVAAGLLTTAAGCWTAYQVLRAATTPDGLYAAVAVAVVAALVGHWMFTNLGDTGRRTARVVLA